jgi:hypothetical protein
MRKRHFSDIGDIYLENRGIIIINRLLSLTSLIEEEEEEEEDSFFLLYESRHI